MTNREQAEQWYHTLEAPELLAMLYRHYPHGLPGGVHGCDIERMWEIETQMIPRLNDVPAPPAPVINLRPWFFIIGFLLAFLFVTCVISHVFGFCN